jgi:3-dehydrosphinganine reductase
MNITAPLAKQNLKYYDRLRTPTLLSFVCTVIPPRRGGCNQPVILKQVKESQPPTLPDVPVAVEDPARPVLISNQEWIMDFYSNKLSLITGGSSGIGLAVARQITQQGGDVIILARRQELLDQAVSELETLRGKPDQKIVAAIGDVTNFESLASVINDLMKTHGVPDVVINSAGVAHPGTFSALDLNIFHWLMDVNYFGIVNVLKLVVPQMQKRRSGAIVNISSMAGFLGVYGYTAYSASKFAVSGFTDALRSELKPYCIQISLVFPPDTDTPQLDYENNIKPFITKEIAGSAKSLSPEFVAKEILTKAAKGKYLILPGSEAKLFYFAHHLVGRHLYPIMDMMVRSSIRKRKFKK